LLAVDRCTDKKILDKNLGGQEVPAEGTISDIVRLTRPRDEPVVNVSLKLNGFGFAQVISRLLVPLLKLIITSSIKERISLIVVL
jgi:hypothetical protein